MPEHPAWIIDDPQFVGPDIVELHVHETVGAMHDWYREHDRNVIQGGWQWDAVTSDQTGRADEPRYEVHVARTRLWSSIIVHEATHVALLAYARHHLRKHRRARAWRHIRDHTEQMPEMIGNLSAHMLTLLRSEYPDQFDTDIDDPTIPEAP